MKRLYYVTVKDGLHFWKYEIFDARAVDVDVSEHEYESRADARDAALGRISEIEGSTI